MRRDMRWLLGALAVAVVGELAIEMPLRVGAVADSRLDWRDVVAWTGLAWTVLLVALVALVARRYLATHRSLLDRTDQLSATAATSHEWMWQTDCDLMVSYCSPAVTELLGYGPDRMVGRSFFDFIDAADQARTRAILDAAVRSSRGWTDVEMRWRHADGHVVSLQGSAVAVHDRHGQLTGFRGNRRPVPVDTTDRNRLDQLACSIDGLLARRNMRIALQPIINLDSGHCYAVEALARFPDQRPPDQWFADAHATGRGIDLELLAIDTALAQLGHLPPQTRLSINASPAAILDPRFADRLTTQPLERIAIEITEHAVVALYDDLHSTLAPLRRRGLHIAVDDTGAGYASFSHVLQLRPDVIKLDRSWLHNIATDQARRTLVTAAVLLALDLGATVTAEGVETQDQLDALSDFGVDGAQGFLLARPSTDPEDWTTWTTTQWRPLGITHRVMEPELPPRSRQTR